ncbi:hypothetical protein MXM81_03810 [Serratia plymuthica]|uniref:hypothetical protein n=1 Tax=Serratia plymuthica TaxID=82996 RepID=UPI002DBE428C|nr:hypothetical protein [Serratia plymuthica]MEB6538210.1 hypothetical protein [Serratia plymuthica]
MNNSILFRQLAEGDADDVLAFRLNMLKTAPEDFGMLYEESWSEVVSLWRKNQGIKECQWFYSEEVLMYRLIKGVI